MRTNIVINDELMSEAQRLTGLKTKKETVHKALQLLVRMQAQQDLRKLRGKVDWEGNLDQMRTNVEFISESTLKQDG